jgi:CRP-like cAMP-binding protein
MTDADAARIPILAVLSPRDRSKVLANARRRTWAPGETLVQEGGDALNLFLIESGRVRVEQGGAVVGGLEAGDFFGELGLLERHPRTATVVAETGTTCILLPAWEFRALLDEHPEMAVPMVHALIARLHRVSPHEH